jgi:hypothetical protein
MEGHDSCAGAMASKNRPANCKLLLPVRGDDDDDANDDVELVCVCVEEGLDEAPASC